MQIGVYIYKYIFFFCVCVCVFFFFPDEERRKEGREEGCCDVGGYVRARKDSTFAEEKELQPPVFFF